MAVKININMPKQCSECPCFEMPCNSDRNYIAWMGVPLCGTCKLLPIKDLDGNTIKWQTVSTREEIEKGVRSKHCPLKECK